MRKDIQNYEGRYQVDKFGNVYSLQRRVKRGNCFYTVKGKKLKNYKAKNGYYVVNLHKNNISKTCYVHDLVAKVFIGEKEKGITVNHKDGNKLNNNIDNLEYCSYCYNNEHARKTGLNKFDISTQTIRYPVLQIDLNGNVLREYESALEACRKTGIHHISCVCRGERKTAGGYKWEYK